MKRVINGILVILMLSFTACSKSGSDDVDTGKSPIPKILVGNWNCFKYHRLVYSENSGDVVYSKLQFLDPEVYYFSFSEDGKCLRIKNRSISKVLDFYTNNKKLVLEDEEYTILELTDSKLTLQQITNKYDEEFQEKVRIEDTYYYTKL